MCHVLGAWPLAGDVTGGGSTKGGAVECFWSLEACPQKGIIQVPKEPHFLSSFLSHHLISSWYIFSCHDAINHVAVQLVRHFASQCHTV